MPLRTNLESDQKVRLPLPHVSVRRFLYMAVVAFWLGGFTFYAVVVIPIGMKVLGSHLRQGFVTQEVTRAINWSAAAAAPVLLWNTIALRKNQGRLVRRGLLITLTIIFVVQLELFALHPSLDRLLDAHAREILDEERFDLLHRIYLLSSTVQWAAGVVHVWCVAASRPETAGPSANTV